MSSKNGCFSVFERLAKREIARGYWQRLAKREIARGYWQRLAKLFTIVQHACE